jgi:hypothetical protein
MLFNPVSRRLTLPVHQDIVGVVMGEHTVPVGIVPSIEVKIIHALEILVDLILVHGRPFPRGTNEVAGLWNNTARRFRLVLVSLRGRLRDRQLLATARGMFRSSSSTPRLSYQVVRLHPPVGGRAPASLKQLMATNCGLLR